MHHTLFEERMSIFIGLNAICQFVGDVILEALGLIPPRINHLAMTFLNAFISFKTLSAIQKDKFRFLHEDCQVFFVLELLLIIGDVYYSFHDDWGEEFISLRLTFVCLSTFNWIFVTWIMIKYKLYHITYQGGHEDVETETWFHGENDASDKEDEHGSIHKDLSHAAIELAELHKKISIMNQGEFRDGDQKTQEASPELDPIDENMQDYHGNIAGSEDSLSDNKSKQPSYVVSNKAGISRIGSPRLSTLSSGYHHTPVPWDDNNHEDMSIYIGQMSNHGHDTVKNTLKLHHGHSRTFTKSEVP